MRSTDFIKEVDALAAEYAAAKTQEEITDVSVSVEYLIYLALANNMNPTLAAMTKLAKLGNMVDAANATVLEATIKEAELAWVKSN